MQTPIQEENLTEKVLSSWRRVRFAVSLDEIILMPGPSLQQVQRMGLQQTLSPQMQQSLHLLQAATMDLNTLIRQELTTNPVLEEAPPEETIGDSREEEISSDPQEMEEKMENAPEQENDKEFEELAQLDQEWRDYFNQTTPPRQRSAEEERLRQTFFESVARVDTLQDHLLRQLQVQDMDASLRQLCETMIGNLDGRGFLSATTEELAAWSENKPDLVDKALALLQSLDPIGVGARDLKECLQLQLRRLGHREDSLPMRIVGAHLSNLAAKHYAEIAHALGACLHDVHRAAALISTLNPQPGSSFDVHESRYLTPDLAVQKIGDDWVVLMNDDWLPHLRINNTYRDILGQAGQTSEVKNYVRDRLRSAKFFIKSIHQRQQTILKISQQIVRVQVEFLEQGRDFLKPLTMTEVAEWIGVHETTVSRAIANKSMQTPHGIFELKYFFTPGIRVIGGGSITPDRIKATIAELVADEPADHPFSDQELTEQLKDKGIPIARRTVAKYREELRILPSHQRKSK